MKLNQLPFWPFLLLIPVLILSACAPAASIALMDDVVTSNTASSTPTPSASPPAHPAYAPTDHTNASTADPHAPANPSDDSITHNRSASIAWTTHRDSNTQVTGLTPA